MDIFNSSFFDYSTDLDFYICNIFYWKQKLVNLGLNISLPIDNDILLKEQCLDIAGRSFNSGPVFPFLLFLTILIGNSNYLIGFFLLLLVSYLFLAKEVTFLKGKSTKKIMLILLILCPSILWLAISPSTDLLSSVLWLSSLFCFKKYIKIKCNYIRTMSSDKSNKFFYLFAFLNLLIILTRPLVILILFTCLAWLIFQIISSRAIYRQYNFVKKTNKYLFWLNSLTPISILMIFILFVYQSLYSKYGAVNDSIGMIFWAFSPPAPLDLHKTIKIFLREITETSILQNSSFLQILILFLKSLVLLINQSIYGLLSLSGIQSKFPITFENVLSLRVIAATLKSLFGIFILLPSILLSFYKFIRYRSKTFFNDITILEPNKIYHRLIEMISILYTLSTLLLIPHIRYLTPVIPFLISGLLISLDNKVYKKESFI